MSDWRRRDQRRAEREAEEQERDERRRAQQAECAHINGRPSQWDWETGAVLEMSCQDCGATNWIGS